MGEGAGVYFHAFGQGLVIEVKGEGHGFLQLQELEGKGEGAVEVFGVQHMEEHLLAGLPASGPLQQEALADALLLCEGAQRIHAGGIHHIFKALQGEYAVGVFFAQPAAAAAFPKGL